MIRRHSLVRLSVPPDDPKARAWHEAGFPFVVARTRPGEELSLGFSPPPANHDERPPRIALAAKLASVAGISRPPFPTALATALSGAPPGAIGVIGSRMWEMITGHKYSREGSDWDLVVEPGPGSLRAWSDVFVSTAASAGVRMDVEISLPAHGEFHLGEWMGPSDSILLKSLDGVHLETRGSVRERLREHGIEP